MIAERLAAARQELAAKSPEQIDADTAAVWGARAVAAFELYRTTGNAGWYAEARVFRHEAIEHASGGPAGLVEQIKAELTQLSNGAL